MNSAPGRDGGARGAPTIDSAGISPSTGVFSRRGLLLTIGSSVAAGLLIGAVGVTFDLATEYLALLVAGVGGVAALTFAWLRFEWFLLGLLCVRPMFDLVSVSGAGPSVAIGLIFVIFTSALLLRRLRAHRLVMPSGIAIGVLLVVAAASLSTLTSVLPAASASATVRLLASALMFVLLEQLLATRAITRTQLLTAMGVVGSVVCLFSIVGFGGFAQFYDDSISLNRLKGPFVHPSVLAKFLGIVVILLVGWAMFRRGRVRWLCLAALLPAVALLGFTYTRAAWAATFLSILYLAARKNWRFVPAIAGAVVLAVLTIPALYARVSDLWVTQAAAEGVPENSMAWRVGYWLQLLPLARMTPINGVGIDLIPLLGGEGLNAHNVWVQVYVEQGVVGVAALIAMLAGFVITLRSQSSPISNQTGSDGRLTDDAISARIAVAVALFLLILMQTENLLNETTTLWYGAVVIACGYARPPQERRQPTDRMVGLSDLILTKDGVAEFEASQERARQQFPRAARVTYRPGTHHADDDQA